MSTKQNQENDISTHTHAQSRQGTYPVQRDLSVFYQHAQDPRMDQDLKEVRQRYDNFVNKWFPYSQQRDARADPIRVAEALEEYEEMQGYYLHGTRASSYFWLLSCIQYDPKSKGLQAKADEQSKQLLRSIQFFTLSLQGISPDQQKQLLQEDVIQPYQKFLKTLWKSADYKLSEKEESLLTYTSKGSYEMRVQMIQDALSQEEVHIQGKSYTMSDVASIITDRSHPLRSEVIPALGKIYDKHSSVANIELNAVLEHRKTIDTLRGFTRPDSHRHLHDDLETSAVDALIAGVTNSNHISQERYSLRNKVLDLTSPSYHDRSLVYEKQGVSLPSYTFQESVDLVCDMMSTYDKKFADFLHAQLQKGRIDVYPRKGKVGGAFQVGLGKYEENFVLLNHTDDFNSMMTFAHEIGHMYHSYLTGEHQSPLYYQYSMLCAEVASITMEELIYRYLLDHCDDPEVQAQLRWKHSANSISAIHRQIALYRFEQHIHRVYREEGFVPMQTMNDMFVKEMESYMGSDIQWNHGAELSRVAWPHIRNYFYVYSYAGASLLAQSLADQIYQDPSYRSVYRQHLLQTGSSRSPVDVFASLERDITQEKTRISGVQSLKKTIDYLQAYHAG